LYGAVDWAESAAQDNKAKKAKTIRFMLHKVRSNLLILVTLANLTGQETIQLKLVDCETSGLYWSCTGVNAKAKETHDKLIEELQKDWASGSSKRSCQQHDPVLDWVKG
jgi:hypothetical protein